MQSQHEIGSMINVYHPYFISDAPCKTILNT